MLKYGTCNNQGAENLLHVITSCIMKMLVVNVLYIFIWIFQNSFKVRH